MIGFNIMIMFLSVCWHIKRFFDQLKHIEIEDSGFKKVLCKHCHLEIHYHCHYNGFSIDSIHIMYHRFENSNAIHKTVNIKKLHPLLNAPEWSRIINLKELIGKKIPKYNLIVISDNA